MMTGQAGLLPEEILRTQAWVHEVFQEAGRGLPWPQQLSLMAVEQVITLGMFGGLLASAWFIQELQQRSTTPQAGPDLGPWIKALEQATLGPLPQNLQDVVRRWMAMGPEARDVRVAADMLLEPLIAHLQAQAPGGVGFRSPL